MACLPEATLITDDGDIPFLHVQHVSKLTLSNMGNSEQTWGKILLPVSEVRAGIRALFSLSSQGHMLHLVSERGSWPIQPHIIMIYHIKNKYFQ